MIRTGIAGRVCPQGLPGLSIGSATVVNEHTVREFQSDPGLAAFESPDNGRLS